MATVITGVAAQDNGSSVVQVFARKEHRGWRYRMDVYVDGLRVFFDDMSLKIQTFRGASQFLILPLFTHLPPFSI